MDWLAPKHPLLVHLPIAAALLLPLPLLAAQRAGRGIKPWWNACRYLAWMGLIGLLPAVISGLAHAHRAGLLVRGLAPAGPARLHEAAGLAALAFGALTLLSLYRGRKEHEGIGVLSLLLGLLWAGTSTWGALNGHVLRAPRPATQQVSAPAPAPAPIADTEAQLPLRALDFARLEPMHPEPLRSRAHGELWVRAFVTPGSEALWRDGGKLPRGAYAVLATQLDRWGRPGPDAGPLFFVEGGDRPRFAVYWGRVPADRREAYGGAERVYWRGEEPRLADCLRCHGEGLSAPAERTKPRRRRTVEE